MSSKPEFESPWVLIDLKQQVFAVQSKQVQAMIALPHVTVLPESPHYVRGLIDLRGKSLPLVDLRLRFEMDSRSNEVEDFCSLMDQREQDHRNWVAELEASVREEREFTLATDPHKCAFGKWYDTYKNDNLVLENVLNRFDTPHKNIHAIALNVRTHLDRGDMDGAMAIINQCREGDLAEMIHLFEEARKISRDVSREIAVVAEGARGTFAFTVDNVLAVEILEESFFEDLPPVASDLKDHEIVTGIASRSKDSEIILTLDSVTIIHPADSYIEEKIESSPVEESEKELVTAPA